MIIAGVFWLLTTVLVALFVGRAWRAGRSETRHRFFDVRGRGQVLRSGIDAVVALALVRALFPPPGWASWLWVVAAGAVGIGIAGVILRWRELPGSDRRWPTVIYGVVGAGLVAVLA